MRPDKISSARLSSNKRIIARRNGLARSWGCNLFHQAILEPFRHFQSNALLGQTSKHFFEHDVGDFLHLILTQLTEDR